MPQSEFHQKMTGAFQGRPHWGKEIVSPWQAARRYGADLERFLDVRRALDPKQRFLNPFLRDEVFGLGRRVVQVPAAASDERAPRAERGSDEREPPVHEPRAPATFEA